MHVIGSTNLVQTLNENDLVDEFRFIIDPIGGGGGKRVSTTTARFDDCDWSIAK